MALAGATYYDHSKPGSRSGNDLLNTVLRCRMRKNGTPIIIYHRRPEPSQDENGKQRVLLLLSFFVLLRSSSFFSGCFLNLFGPSWFSLVLLRASWFLSVPLGSKWFFFVLLCSCPPFLFESGVRVPSSPFGPCLYYFWTMLASCFGHWGAWAHHVPTCSQLWPPLGLWGCLFGSILVPLGSIWGLWGSIWVPLGLHLGALGPHFGAMWPHPCPLGGLWPTSAK